MSEQLSDKVLKVGREVEEGYDADQVPLVAYGALMGVYALTFGTLFWAATRRKGELSRPGVAELALLTLGAYKLSRIVTMSFIGSPLRAPFTTRGESLKGGEVQDEARGQGLQRAIGNLVTCPFCFNVWANTFFTFAYLISPRPTITAAQILSMAAAGDVLHFGYRNLRETSE